MPCFRFRAERFYKDVRFFFVFFFAYVSPVAPRESLPIFDRVIPVEKLISSAHLKIVVFFSKFSIPKKQYPKNNNKKKSKTWEKTIKSMENEFLFESISLIGHDFENND